MKFLIVLVMCLSFFACKELEDKVDQMEKKEVDKLDMKINSQVVDEALKEFEIVKKGGDKMEICVRAGFVAEAYLQAKDEAKYTEWKKTEKDLCKAAGMPQ